LWGPACACRAKDCYTGHACLLVSLFPLFDCFVCGLLGVVAVQRRAASTQDDRGLRDCCAWWPPWWPTTAGVDGWCFVVTCVCVSVCLLCDDLVLTSLLVRFCVIAPPCMLFLLRWALRAASSLEPAVSSSCGLAARLKHLPDGLGSVARSECRHAAHTHPATAWACVVVVVTARSAGSVTGRRTKSACTAARAHHSMRNQLACPSLCLHSI
jgi:hypothetical protein